jgi:hypothetical protein
MKGQLFVLDCDDPGRAEIHGIPGQQTLNLGGIFNR